MTKPEEKTSMQPRVADAPQRQASAASAPAQQPPVDEAAQRQAERDKADLESAPQHVQDAAARQGGDVPRAAPKAGEGTRVSGSDSSRVVIPELEPAPPPAQYRAAPTAPGDDPERESWPSAAISFDDAMKLDQLRVRTKDPLSAGVFVGSVRATRQGAVVNVAEVRVRGEAHLRALLSDPRVEVARVDASKKT